MKSKLSLTIDRVISDNYKNHFFSEIFEVWNSSEDWDPRLPAVLAVLIGPLTVACEFEIKLSKMGRGDEVSEFARLWMKSWCNFISDADYIRDAASKYPWTQDTEIWKLFCINSVLNS